MYQSDLSIHLACTRQTTQNQRYPGHRTTASHKLHTVGPSGHASSHKSHYCDAENHLFSVDPVCDLRPCSLSSRKQRSTWQARASRARLCAGRPVPAAQVRLYQLNSSDIDGISCILSSISTCRVQHANHGSAACRPQVRRSPCLRCIMAVVTLQLHSER